jgi:aminodeoxyfutalosine synthase
MEKDGFEIDWQRRLESSGLADIYKKVKNSERLGYEEGIRLFGSPDLTSVGFIANIVRERKNGDTAYFIRNQHINHTNICRNQCRFCAFYRRKDQEGAYQMTLDEIFDAVKREKDKPFTEIHIVGGLNPDLSLDFYLEMLRGIKEIRPDIHIQAFTCVEVAWLAETAGIPVEKALKTLKDAGLGSIPGGGAEVFSERLRKEYWSRKLSADDWLNVAGTAHMLGIPTNATILYGHKETIGERVNHLIRLREQQDKTGGFKAFIPLAFHSENTELKDIPPTHGSEDLKMLAVSRLMLDNFDHIKAFWVMLTPQLAALSLAYGTDDIDGTVTEEKITHMAGAKTPSSLTVEELVSLIRIAGRVPVERDTLYNTIRRY